MSKQLIRPLLIYLTRGLYITPMLHPGYLHFLAVYVTCSAHGYLKYKIKTEWKTKNVGEGLIVWAIEFI